MFAYGPVMLHEALLASELLAERGFGLSIINMPWLNRVDVKWLTETLKPYSNIFMLEDHHPAGGLMDNILTVCSEHGLLNGKQMIKFAVEGYPACGTPQQALAFHELDGLSLSKRVMKYCG
jgi:transketolase